MKLSLDQIKASATPLHYHEDASAIAARLHEGAHGGIRGLVVHLFELEDVLVARVPVGLEARLAHDAPVQDLVADALDALHGDALADLAGHLRAVQGRRVEGIRRAELHPLARVALGRGVREVVADRDEALVVGAQTAFADLDAHEG